MRTFAIAALVGSVTGTPTIVFNDGDDANCIVNADGNTLIQYDGSDVHPSFECHHTSATECECNHPHTTHHTGGCKEFYGYNSQKTFQFDGDCTDTGKDVVYSWSKTEGACPTACGTAASTPADSYDCVGDDGSTGNSGTLCGTEPFTTTSCPETAACPTPCTEVSYDGSGSMGPSYRYYSDTLWGAQVVSWNPDWLDAIWEKQFDTNTQHWLQYNFPSPRDLTKATMRQYPRSDSSVDTQGCGTPRTTVTRHGHTVINFCDDVTGDRYLGYSGAFCANIAVQYSNDGSGDDSSWQTATTWPAQIMDNEFTWNSVGAYSKWRFKCTDTIYNGGNANQWQGGYVRLYTGSQC
jgi:hypothetical protein